jgi:hypothetical protein
MVADVWPAPLPNPTSLRGQCREVPEGGDLQQTPLWLGLTLWLQVMETLCLPQAAGSAVNEGTALGLDCPEHRQGGGMQLSAVSFL